MTHKHTAASEWWWAQIKHSTTWVSTFLPTFSRPVSNWGISAHSPSFPAEMCHRCGLYTKLGLNSLYVRPYILGYYCLRHSAVIQMYLCLQRRLAKSQGSSARGVQGIFHHVACRYFNMVLSKSGEVQPPRFFFSWLQGTKGHILYLSLWSCHQRSLMSLHWRRFSILKASCNSHLSAWSLLLPLFRTWFCLLKQSIPFVSFCVVVLVLTESSDKYHPHTSVRVPVSVVSSNTHTSLCDLFVLLHAKSPLRAHTFSTRFPLLRSVSFYCCARSRITYNSTHKTISTMSSW